MGTYSYIIPSEFRQKNILYTTLFSGVNDEFKNGSEKKIAYITRQDIQHIGITYINGLSESEQTQLNTFMDRYTWVAFETISNIGPTGGQGIQGITGKQGAAGLLGSTGTSGIQGAIGTTGLLGATGTSGVQGAIGTTGDTGIQGIQGVIGDTGAIGLQGVIGDTGLQGVIGDTGTQGSYDQELNTFNDVEFNSLQLSNSKLSASATYDLLLEKGTDFKLFLSNGELAITDDGAAGASLSFRKFIRINGIPQNTNNGARIGNIQSEGYTGGDVRPGAKIDSFATQNWTDSDNIGSNIILSTANNGVGVLTEKLKIDTNGVTINTGVNSINLPNTRGDGQDSYLRLNANGSTSFQKTAYGNQGFNNNEMVTTIEIAGVFVSVVGTRTVGLLSDFTSDANGLTYTGETNVFTVNISATWAVDEGKSQQCEIAIFKQGFIVDRTKQLGALDDKYNFPRNVSTNTIISLATGDTIDVRIANNSSITDILISNFNLSITGV
jgi:hypothetical protein